MVGRSLLTVSVLVEACAPELHSRLKMHSRNDSIRQVRGDIVAYSERRRDSSIRPAPTETGNNEDDDEEHTGSSLASRHWGGATDPYEVNAGSWVHVGGATVQKRHSTPRLPTSLDRGGRYPFPEEKGTGMPYNSGREPPGNKRRQEGVWDRRHEEK